jgi:hypothetical protein
MVCSIAGIGGIAVMLVSLTATPSEAQQFSANVVNTQSSPPKTSRLYVGQTKIRIQNLTNGQPDGAAIFDVANNSMTFLSDKDRMYIGGGNSSLVNNAVSKMGGASLWRVFRPANASDPCTTWNSVVRSYAQLYNNRTPPTFSCRSEGSDNVDGRPAQKWAVTSVDSGTTKHGEVWIDNALHVVTRSVDQGERGGMELRDIHEGSQAESLFEIPAGYKPFDPTALLAKLKGQGGGAAIGDMLGAAAKDVGNDAATSTTDEAKQKTKDEVKKKIKGILHFP